MVERLRNVRFTHYLRHSLRMPNQESGLSSWLYVAEILSRLYVTEQLPFLILINILFALYSHVRLYVFTAGLI